MTAKSIDAILTELKHLKELLWELKNNHKEEMAEVKKLVKEKNGQIEENTLSVTKLKTRLGIYAFLFPILTLVIGYLINSLI